MFRIVLILVALSLLSYGVMLSSHAETNQQALAEALEGAVTLEQVDNYTNRWWERFEPDDQDAWNEAVQRIRGTKARVQIEVFFGTWCHDSEREIPRLLKLLEDLEIKGSDGGNEIGKDLFFQIRWFALDEKKRTPAEEIEAFRVTRTPTVVLLRDQSEVGRIVEHPARSLEEDLQRLLEGSARGLVSASEIAIRDYLRPPKPPAAVRQGPAMNQASLGWFSVQCPRLPFSRPSAACTPPISASELKISPASKTSHLSIWRYS